MKIQYVTAVALCLALSACSEDVSVRNPFLTDGPTIDTGPTLEPGGGSTIGSEAENDGTNQAVEDQLLNQGNSAAPLSAWACAVPGDVDNILFGFFGQPDGFLGFLTPDGDITGSGVSYTINTSGTSSFLVPLDNQLVPFTLQVPSFTSGTQFSTTITFGTETPFQTNCELTVITPDGQPPIGSEPPAPTGNLESQLLNRGTQASPSEGWRCEGTLFGFYGSGQGRIGQEPSFNPMQYSVTATTVIIEANDTVGNMSDIQFSGPDNFSTLLFDGSNTLGIECTRFDLSLN